MGDVNRLSCDDYGLGGMTDIYQASFQGETVALKHPRVFTMVAPSRVNESKKVRDLYPIPVHIFTIDQVFYRDALAWYNLHHDHILPCLGVYFSPELNDSTLR